MWRKKTLGHALENGRTFKSTDENPVAGTGKGGTRSVSNYFVPNKTRRKIEVKASAKRRPIVGGFRVPIPRALKEPKPCTRDDAIVLDLPNDVLRIDISKAKSISYSYDVIKYAKSVEGQLQYPMRFLEMFPRGNRTREVLVDWLNEVAHYLKLQPQTLHLTVQLLDRYMMVSDVKLANIQLLGLASLLIATKYEERWPPSVKKLSHLSDNTYSENEIRKMEEEILMALQWKFHIPTPITFLDKGFDVVGRNASTCELTHYILELALLSTSPMNCSQSVLASAAMYLAHAILEEEKKLTNRVCIRSLNHYLDNNEVDVVDCIRTFANLLLKASDTQAATKSYWIKHVSKKKSKELLITEMLVKVEDVLESDLLTTRKSSIDKRLILTMEWMD